MLGDRAAKLTRPCLQPTGWKPSLKPSFKLSCKPSFKPSFKVGFAQACASCKALRPEGQASFKAAASADGKGGQRWVMQLFRMPSNPTRTLSESEFETEFKTRWSSDV